MQRNVAIGTLFVVLLAGVMINVSSLQAASQPGPRCSITGCPKAGGERWRLCSSSTRRRSAGS